MRFASNAVAYCVIRIVFLTCCQQCALTANAARSRVNIDAGPPSTVRCLVVQGEGREAILHESKKGKKSMFGAGIYYIGKSHLDKRGAYDPQLIERLREKIANDIEEPQRSSFLSRATLTPVFTTADGNVVIVSMENFTLSRGGSPGRSYYNMMLFDDGALTAFSNMNGKSSSHQDVVRALRIVAEAEPGSRLDIAFTAHGLKNYMRDFHDISDEWKKKQRDAEVNGQISK